MNRYQILIEYVGTNFRGWQIQKKGPTIQGLIQEKLSKLLKEKIVLHGQGRTDAGVHAFEQSAHFDCKNKITDKIKFLKSINHFLNLKDIAIKNIKKRNNKFHARFSAKQRIYKYFIFNQISQPAKSPIKTIKSIKIKSSKNKIEFQFSSQSFLQHQVRSMVGCLKYLGETKWDLKTFEKRFKSKKRTLCAPPAPPSGLFLFRVLY